MHVHIYIYYNMYIYIYIHAYIPMDAFMHICVCVCGYHCECGSTCFPKNGLWDNKLQSCLLCFNHQSFARCRKSGLTQTMNVSSELSPFPILAILIPMMMMMDDVLKI